MQGVKLPSSALQGVKPPSSAQHAMMAASLRLSCTHGYVQHMHGYVQHIIILEDAYCVTES